MIVHKHRDIVSRRGYGFKKCTCGEGLLDSIEPTIDLVSGNKDLIKQVADIVVNPKQISKNTKKIVDSIKNKDQLTTDEKLAFNHKHLKDIVNRINNIKMGSGFEIV